MPDVIKVGLSEFEVGREYTERQIRSALSGQDLDDILPDIVSALLAVVSGSRDTRFTPLTIVKVERDATEDYIESLSLMFNDLMEREPIKYGYLANAIITRADIEIQQVKGRVLSKTVTEDDVLEIRVSADIKPTRAELLATPVKDDDR